MFPRVAEATVTRQESANVSVMGVVTDRENGEPVRNAVVILAPVADDTDESVGPSYTLGVDDEGRFRSPSLEAGRYLVGIRAPGYHPLDERVTVRGGRAVVLEVQLAPAALDIEGVVVSVERNLFMEEGGFYARRREGLGTFFTREELSDLGVVRPTDVFRHLAGVTFDYAGSPTAPLLVFRQGCRPDIIIDGTNHGPEVRLDDVTAIDFIEGVEIYRGATAPGTLSRSPCGAVIVWTLSRDPEGGSSFGWKKWTLIAVIVVLGQLLRP